MLEAEEEAYGIREAKGPVFGPCLLLVGEAQYF